MQSIYVHFPFCESKCHYCDFYSLGKERTRPGDESQFEAALRKEAESIATTHSPSQLSSIFLGGGTPSMTPPESMAKALEPLWKTFQLTPETEWTMEANPSSVNPQSLSEYRALGINRISLGVQAMRPDLLELLGRVHSQQAALGALEAIFKAGFTNVSVDLLCGVPGQSEQDVIQALTQLTAFPITHLSCYLLTLPKHHALFPQLPCEETQLQHLLVVHDWMTAHGFEHYEISNFAKPGKQAVHNLHYWNGSSYLGLGPSAHSYDAKQQIRWKNVSSLHRYASLLNQGLSPIESKETLTTEQIRLEQWMLKVRLSTGFPKTWLSTESQKQKALRLTHEGLIEQHPNLPERLRLTAKGFALSDQILQVLT
ncbi:MAG: radical SAM family heme chaperone HemW [Bdellovibrionia bacterium]